MLESIKLKKSDLAVSRLCVGGCPLGQYGWGKVDKQELIGAVRAALDLGINFFDTADVYGLGESERTLGEALGARRGEAVIATKYGVRLDIVHGTWYDNTAPWSEAALQASLQRLGTDYVDLYLVHYRDGRTPIAELTDSLERLRRKGLIRCYGFSNVFSNDTEEIRPFMDHYVAIQDEYSLANRSHEADLKHLAHELQLTPLTWGSLGQGILTGKYGRDSVFGVDDRRSRATYVNFHGEKLEKNLRILEVMKRIAERTGKPLSAVAARFILDTIPDSVVLTGVKNRRQVEENLKALDWRLDAEDLRALDEISA